MRTGTSWVLSLSALLAVVLAAPAPIPAPVEESHPLEARAVTTLTAAQVTAFKPYTYFAKAGGCTPSVTKTWTCGASCTALPGFKVTATGGDGSSSQYWFAGYYPTLQTIVVSHQGTDASKILPVLTDLDFLPQPLDSSLFPGVPSTVEVHGGFADSHERVAAAILAAVKTAISANSATKVTLVGHSLGGALALLDSVYLPLHLPSTITFKTVTYGMPRVGNQAFADYVDAHLTDLTHINNKDDPVPILPGRGLGFHHPSGEVHIKDNNAWVACSGQDNTSAGCTVTDVGNILIGDPDDHGGPYDGVSMGC